MQMDEARLAEANARYMALGEGPDGPEPGTYQMQLRSAVMREAEGSGKLIIRWTWVILDGAYQGEEISDTSSLESEHPFPLKNLKKIVRALGHEPPPTLMGYQELCPMLTRNAPVVLAGLSYSKDDYKRVKIIELLQAVGSAAIAPAGPAAPAAPAPAMAPPVARPVGAPAPFAPPAVRIPTAPAAPSAAVVAVGNTVEYIDQSTGQVYTGVVEEITGTTAVVGLNETEAFKADVSQLKVAEAAPPAAAVTSALPPVATAEDPQLIELRVLASAFGFPVNDLSTKAEIVSAMAEDEWTEIGVGSAKDIALLRAVGIEVVPAASPAPPQALPTPPIPPTTLAAPTPAAPTVTRVTRKKAKKKAKKKKKAARRS
jgi:hypothetical protein